VCYRHCDLLDLTPDRDGTFDLVLSAYTLHHVPDLPAALEQIRSLVRPGGQAILVDICDLPRDPAWFRADARRTLLLDLRHRRRPIREAVLLYRLSVHPAWLDHLAADIALTRAEFEQAYLATFATAEITPM
jgi:SAM-dependent methyltransferase